MSKKTISPRLARNYHEPTSEKSREVYRQWASTYDRELIDDFGYRAPEAAVECLLEYFPSRQIEILDMGCGTGLVGELLCDAGYEQIDGLDLSPEMILKAAEKEVYRQLGEADLSTSISLDPIYDAILCVGVFSHGSRQPFDLPKLFTGLKRGGVLIATVNGKGWHDIGWSALLEKSSQENGFQVESLRDIPYLTGEGIPGKLLIARPTPQNL